MLTYLLYTACATALAALICVTAVFASEIDMKNMSTRLSILLACLLVVGGAASIGFRQAVADKAWTRRNIDIEEAQKSLANADFSLSCLPDGSVPDTRGSVADVSPCAERGSLRIVRSATNGRYRYFRVAANGSLKPLKAISDYPLLVATNEDLMNPEEIMTFAAPPRPTR
jgi:hypothetical protein